AVAIEALLDDNNPNADFYISPADGEDWAVPIEPVTIGIDDLVLGEMKGWLEDAHSRLNLNNLVKPAPGGGPDQIAIDQFDRLFADLKIDRRILDNIVDWIDDDTVPYQFGAEDGSYTSLEVPFRPANNYFLSASELRAVHEVDEDVYAVLKDYVTALPPGWCGTGAGISVTAVNLNFASAPVIQALDPSITESQAEVWTEEAENTAFLSISEIGGLPENVKAGGYADVKSSCFELRVLVNIGSSVLSMYSLLDRSASSGVVTRIRSYGIE
ncbi:MAG: type II secretion system minor pseudopilin GspK, partial [Gammaproteobacteria bacterium]|nr:type II secretion system minor pseudopilin GspK [Gammaproteobacteria bacterium]